VADRDPADLDPTEPAPIELRAFYSVPELAKAANVTRWKMRRLLESCGVKLQRNGSDLVVFLSAIRDELPDLYRSLICAEEVRRDRLDRRRWSDYW